MDRKWMSANRLSVEYKNGVDLFLRFFSENVKDLKFTCCPCIKCGNVRKMDLRKIKQHLFFNGIDKSYTVWYMPEERMHVAPTPPSRPNEVRRNIV